MLNNVIFYLTVVVTIASLSSGLFRKSRNCWENSCPKIFAIRWSNSSGSRIFVFWFCEECTLAHKLFLYEDITVDGPSKETRCMILLSISTSFTRKSSALFQYQPSLHIFARLFILACISRCYEILVDQDWQRLQYPRHFPWHSDQFGHA